MSIKKEQPLDNEYTRLIMKTFNHVGNDLKDLKTENIEGKRFYVTPKE